MPYQDSLHDGAIQFVEAPIFNDNKIDGIEGADYWIEYWKELHGEMKTFNGFMHNKMQFFTSDLNAYVSPMIKDKIPLLMRSSLDDEGAEVLHVSLHIQGIVFELVGPRTTFDGTYDIFEWDTTECPEAHKLTTSMSVLAKLVNADTSGSTFELDGRPRLLLHTISLTNAGLLDQDAMNRYKQLHSITGAETNLVHEQDGQCTVVDVNWSNQKLLTVRFVDNVLSSTGKKTLLDYDNYVASDHSDFLFKTDDTDTITSNPSSWDRYLDQHIGLWYDNADEDECNARAVKVRESITAASIPYAERSEPDAHLFYVGYTGNMAFEYQFPSCDGGVSDATSESACFATNSAL